MVVVHRAYGMQFVIFLNDHDPPHVHVFGDGHAKITLVGPTGAPELVRHEDMTRSDVRRAMAEVKEQQAAMLQRWSEIHG